VTRAVILAAGLGTRMLPATKAVPKEMLPIVDKPLIQYAVEEAVAGGIAEVIFVVADGKEAIREHFSADGRVETTIGANGNSALAAAVRAPASLATFHFVKQDEPRGIAHAVACAREFVEGEPFVLMFPDDIILADCSPVAQLIQAHQTCGGSVIAVEEVERADIPQYGICDPINDANPARLRGIIEKPRADEAPSNLGVVGRYILSATIFNYIDQLKPGKNGELQITDAFAAQIAAGEPVSAFRYEGTRYDTGRPLGLITANIAAALARPELGAQAAARFEQALHGSKR
ncbi:MAG: UTP--glucose-1-phosphate uridylyltransferase, partial [Tepidiformaceae bacterium]